MDPAKSSTSLDSKLAGFGRESRAASATTYSLSLGGGAEAVGPSRRRDGKQPMVDDRTEEERAPLVVNIAKARGTTAVRLLAVGVLLSVVNITTSKLVSYMRNVWGIRGHNETLRLADNRFLIDFSTTGDYEHVTTGGPWRYEGDAVLVRKMEDHEDPQTVPFETVPIWVQFWDVPFYLLSKQLARNLGEKLGELICIDIKARGHIANKILRALIHLPVARALQRWITLEDELTDEEVVVSVFYERLPSYCTSCGVIGHPAVNCELPPELRTTREASRAGDKVTDAGEIAIDTTSTTENDIHDLSTNEHATGNTENSIITLPSPTPGTAAANTSSVAVQATPPIKDAEKHTGGSKNEEGKKGTWKRATRTEGDNQGKAKEKKAGGIKKTGDTRHPADAKEGPLLGKRTGPNVQNPEAVQVEIKGILCVSTSTFEEKYLGFPTPEGRMKDGSFQPIMARFGKRLTNRDERLMSNAAKDTLIKSVAQALPSHIMSIFKLSIGFCEQYERLIREFLWGDDKNQRRVHWTTWDNLTKLKHNGGMGFRDMHLFNQAILARFAWRLIQKPDCLCARVLKAKYFPHGSLLDTVFAIDPSPVWRGIEFGIELLKKGTLGVPTNYDMLR
ncbi:hypothetical protein ACQ4PT_009638 [Festuca glaucescens]